MVDTASPSQAPANRGFVIWFNALMFVGFIAFMVMTVEGTLAWIVGSFAHSPTVGLVVFGLLGLPTLYWLARCLRHAIAAERDLLAPPPPAG